jgi:YidC/Oxa1 family membrane protein insertase
VGAIWQSVLDAIFWLLKYFYGYVNDWGWAIILLTIAFRVLLIPLTWKQTKSMYELQEIQPKIKALQEKYKNDKEKQQEELMKFYKENKVNPFGGCLPLLLQMPLFIALFTVLRTNLPDYINTLPLGVQATARQFSVIIPDITLSPQQVYSVASTVPTPTTSVATSTASAIATSAVVAGHGGVISGVIAVLPYMVLVVLFGLSVWLPQYLITKDPTQRKTGAYMAIVMLWFGFVSPAGVLLYWVTSSGWQVVQQVITQRSLTRAKDAAAPLVAEAPRVKSTKKAAQPSQAAAPGAPAPKGGSKKKKRKK